MSCAVIIYDNVENDVVLYSPFETENDAETFLQRIWEETYNESLANNKQGSINENQTYHEDDYAQISFIDGRCIRFFQTPVCSPNTAFLHSPKEEK